MKFWLLLLASSLPAQTVQRLYFTRAANAENIADISSALRLVLNVKDVAPGKDSIAVRATYPQAEAGRWLIADFEEPAGIKDRDLHEYRLRDGSGEFLRVFYPDRELTPQAMEERVSLLHALAITQKAISYNAPRAILMRGSKTEVAAAEWLLNELNRPAEEGTHEYRMTGKDDRIQILYTGDFKNAAAKTRLDRLYLMTSPQALVLRGTYGQLQAAMVRLRPPSLAP